MILEAAMAFVLSSPAFSQMQEIPSIYTCESDDISPPLKWQNIPTGAKSLAIIVDDPDAPDPKAPSTIWVHWVAYNLSPEVTELSQGITSGSLPSGMKEGKNDWGQTGYRGPCPPIGRHRYFFKLYALDVVLNDLHNPTKAQLENAMRGHIIAETELVGTYQK